MQFGVMLPHRWLYAAGNTIADFAREAEALGYTSLWVTDHIIVPSYRTERGHIFYEALTTLADVSSLAPRCRLGVAVLALPPRNAVLVAKQVATLDALSQGRVLLGVGTGWIAEELRYLGAAWQQRGPCSTKPFGCSGPSGATRPPTPLRADIRRLPTSPASRSRHSPAARSCWSAA